jgi:LmbE family N-acetylglucosaminyl deacetylase
MCWDGSAGVAMHDRHPDRLHISDLGTVLGVWAHPDDEAYLSAAVMAEARDAGHRVVVATATGGEAGGDGEQRSRELAGSLNAVGVSEHEFLGFHDGHCADVRTDIGTAAVLRLLRQVKPDTILTFGPEGMTGHSDHVAVSRWVTEAWQASGHRGRLLHATLTGSFHRRWGALSAANGIWMPGAVPPSVPESTVALHLSVTGASADRKLAALKAHASQTDGLRRLVGDETFREWWAAETFVQVDRVRAAA